AFGTPLFLFFGWLSDRIGRKPIILGGCALAAICYLPIYQAMVANANVTLDATGKITASNPNILVETVLVFLQVVFVTMVYGPIGNLYAGLAYTITVAVITAIVGWFFIPETKNRKIWEEVGGQESATASARR